jgi:peptide/nickel transport system substrate-binding protein
MYTAKAIVLLLVGVTVTALSLSEALAQKSKDTLRLPVTQPISGVSYYLEAHHETIFTQSAVFDGLIAFDEVALKYEGLLAKSWKQLDDRTFELELRDDIKWHDGQKFSADDVIATVAWIVDPKTRLRFKSYWDWMERAEKISPTAVRLIARAPVPFALSRLAYQTEILPAHIISKLDDMNQFALSPVGTGMYRTTVVDKNKGVFLERNESFKHGGAARPTTNVRRIEVLFVPDSGTQTAQFLARGLDMIPGFDYEQSAKLAKDTSGSLTVTEGISYYYIALDAKGRSGTKPLQDARVRRAIMMGIDREQVRKYLAGDRVAKRQPEAMCWKVQKGCDFSAPLPGYDVVEAKRLLAEAGYKDGFDLELTTLSIGIGPGLATVYSGQLAKIGIRTKIDVVSFPAYFSKQRDGKIQFMASGWHAGGTPDISATASFFMEPGARDYHGDTELQALAQLSDATTDDSKRTDIGRKMFDGLTERYYFMPVSAMPAIFIHTKELTIGGGSFSSFGTNIWHLNWN